MTHPPPPDDPFQLRDLQLVLGTDHRTHYFEVLRDAADRTRLLVFFGMALVETIPDDKTDPQYRLLLARLYNAGARPSALHRAFGIDGKTLRRWGAALVSPDHRETARVLFGVDEARHQRALIQKFVQTVTSAQSLTFVMDRAIFSHALFDYFLEPDSPNHLMTWEKWYHQGQFAAERAVQDFVLTRPRNHRQDLLRYVFRYDEEAWSKRPAIRRILVRAVAPGQHEVEMAILCTDPTRSAEQAD